MSFRNLKGFSLVELVIVIVILGILAVTAIPRFLDVVEDAEDASVEGVTGGVATAVSFVRAEWEISNRQQHHVIFDGVRVQVDPRFGYPTGIGMSVGNAMAMTDTLCQTLFNAILQSAPRNVLHNQNASQAQYTARVLDGAGGSVVTRDGVSVANTDLCVYHQVSSLALDANTGIPAGDLDLTLGNGVIYNPASGQVLSFMN